MTRRATDPRIRRMISGRRSLLRSAPFLRTLLTCMAVALALGGGAASTYALDGVSGENPDTEGALRANCQNLRNLSGLSGGDQVIACDSNGEQCHLFSPTDEGLARLFCENVQEVVPYRGGLVETRVSVVDATTFDSVTGISTGEILCE